MNKLDEPVKIEEEVVGSASMVHTDPEAIAPIPSKKHKKR